MLGIVEVDIPGIDIFNGFSPGLFTDLILILASVFLWILFLSN